MSDSISLLKQKTLVQLDLQPLALSEEKSATDLSSTEEKSSEKVLSVEELNVYIRQLLEGQVGQIWVRGELSNFKAHTSGHFYFSIKDQKAQVNAVMFRGHNSKLKFKPGDGMEVIVRGKITVYEPRGTYQITCDMMEPVGAGALQRAFEQLKEKLKKEGLFETGRKRPLPSFPQHIAVVTSPTGAAIKDILNVLGRRAKSIQVTVVPTIVQGDGAGAKIREALLLAQKIPNVDVIILGRGGGSIEDLWGFNDEALARAIAECRVPVISAVGHEIDFTISDFVADLRAPTPSAAAELVAKSSAELQQKISQLFRLLKISIEKQLKFSIHKLDLLTKSLQDPQKKLQDFSQRNDDLLTRLELAIANMYQRLHSQLRILEGRLPSPQQAILKKEGQLKLLLTKLTSAQARRLENNQSKILQINAVLDSLSPLRVVDRGFSIVTQAQGDRRVIKSVQQVQLNEELNIRLSDGDISVVVSKK